MMSKPCWTNWKSATGCLMSVRLHKSYTPNAAVSARNASPTSCVRRASLKNLINAALPALKETELAAAREVWQRKFGTAPQDEKEKAKQVRFLQSRGFSLDVIFKVLRHDD